MKKILFCAGLAALLWYWWYEPPARWKGMPAAQSPVQASGSLPAPFQQGDFRITPLASYRITAVVMGADRYRFDPGAKISPLDLALAWGPMSVAGVLNELSVSQSGRFYEYRWKDEPPLDPELINRNSANTHCIPANDAIRQQLLAIRRHDLVTLQGLLVEVNFPEGGRWRSSLTRDDTRGGACELMWVTAVERRKISR